jgi:hypothetical protein
VSNDIQIIKRIQDGKESKIFYIDIGDMPSERAKKVIEECMKKHKEK